MKIVEQSQWMKAQKHAVVMAPDKSFEVLQTQNGDSVFFSLGTDAVFYVTREVQVSSSGWNKTDLSSRLAPDFKGDTFKVKTFSVSQNSHSLAIDLALVIAAGGKDYLYLSFGNLNTDAGWAAGVSWINIAYDADPRTALTIADVFLLNIPGSRTAEQTCVVDVWRTPGTNDSLDRYYISASGTPRWKKHLLAIDLDAGSISTCLGQRKQDQCPGIYTFGTIDGTSELLYVPLFNYFRPDRAALPVRLTVPPGAKSIATALNTSGRSNLFVSGSGGLGIYTYDTQLDGAVATTISSSSIVADATELSAATAGGISSIWGINPQGGLFYLICTAGHESDASAWSAPVVLLPSVERYAFFTNINSGHHTLFAHVSGQNIVQLSQDPITTDWHQRRILLPSTAVNDMVEFNGFHTRLEVWDDNGISQGNVQIAVNATSPVTVYINDVYYVLSPSYSINLKTDSSGSVTIIQPADTLAAVCYKISLLSPNSGSLPVNPASKAIQILNSVQSAGDLSAVKVTDSQGNTKSLVSSKVSDADKTAAVSALKQFASIGSTLPADGSRQQSTLQTTDVTAVNNTVHNLAATGADSIRVEAGDFFRMIGQKVVGGLESLVVKVVEGAYHVFCQIGKDLYRAFLDCTSAIAHAIEWVMSKIEVLVEDLVSWLGFIFGWDDIVRTHKVLKNMMKLYALKAVSSIDGIESAVTTAFDGMEAKLNSAAGITDPGLPIGSGTSISSSHSSPQAQWGFEHMKNNASNASDSFTSAVASGFEGVLKDLEGLCLNEVQAIKDMVKQFKEQIMEPYLKLTPQEVIQKLIAIIGDLVLKSAKNIIVKTLDIVKIVATTAIKVMDAPISIPILSPMYKNIAKADLSLLDLICLVVAIPTTIVYKIIIEKAPFPDNNTTSQLIAATSFDAFSSIVMGTSNNNLTVSPQQSVQAKFKAKAVVRPAQTKPTAQPAQMKVTVAPRNIKMNFATINVPTVLEDVKKAKAVLPTVLEVLMLTASLVKVEYSLYSQWQDDVNYIKKDTGESKTPPTMWTYARMPAYLLASLGVVAAAIPHRKEWAPDMNQTLTILGFLKSAVDIPLTMESAYTDQVSPTVSIILKITALVPAIGLLVEDHSKPSDSTGLAYTVISKASEIASIAALSQMMEFPEDAVVLLGANAGWAVASLIAVTNFGLTAGGK